MKYSQTIGILAALLLIGACFLPWAYYPDIQKEFTGFFSEKNVYGRPGKLLVAFSVLAIILFLIRKVWAKRTNIFLCALLIAFTCKSFFLYSSCYQGICPQKRAGLFLVLGSALLVVICAVFPDMRLKDPGQKK